MSAPDTTVGLLREVAQLLREYEQHHLHQVEAQRLGHNPLAIPERQAKADRNGAMAQRIEAVLAGEVGGDTARSLLQRWAREARNGQRPGGGDPVPRYVANYLDP